jgi:Calcineurin-like phosphoesterase
MHKTKPVARANSMSASPESNPPRKSPTGKLYAISDIHLSFAANRTAWSELQPHPGDGLILCGDVGESIEHLEAAFSIATKCFDTVWWCPGNHELYSLPTGSSADVRGEDKYQQCVDVAGLYDVLTPEDEFVVWEGQGGPAVVAPIFTLYDYSFRPEGVTLESTSKFAYDCI